MNKTKSPVSRLEKLKEMRKSIDARIQAVESRAKTSERKKEDRRKILFGAYYLENARKNGGMDEVKRIMDGYLKRDSDRVLFDLCSIEEKNKSG